MMPSMNELPPEWDTIISCGSCLWPIQVHVKTVRDPFGSTLIVQHDGEFSGQAMGGDWRTFGWEGIRAVLQVALDEVCSRSTCMEYGGVRVDADE